MSFKKIILLALDGIAIGCLLGSLIIYIPDGYNYLFALGVCLVYLLCLMEE
jgi:hypothetical protein